MSEEFNEEVDDILRAAFDTITKEALERELEDFKKVEEFLTSKGLIDDASSEVWYVSLSEDPDMDIINVDEEHGEGAQALSIKYKATYDDVYIALQDSKMIHECKADKCVGIITRSEAWASATAARKGIAAGKCDDKTTMHLTTLTTPRGVHIIIRDEDALDCTTYPKPEIRTGDNPLVDALVNAFFHW